MDELQMTFLDSNGRRRTITLRNFRPGLAAQDLETAMNKISVLDVFARDGVNYFQTPQSAHIVTTASRTLFELG